MSTLSWLARRAPQGRTDPTATTAGLVLTGQLPRALRAPHAPLKTTTFTHRVSEEHMTDPMQVSDQLRNLSDKKKPPKQKTG